MNKAGSFYLSLSIMIFLILAGCGDLEINSKWNDGDIIVDGADTDWQNSAVYVEEKKVMVGVKNDGDNLYLYLSSIDRKMGRQIIVRGLTVWFDPEGGDDKSFGIRFPIGMEDPRMLMANRDNPEINREEFNEKYRSSLDELEIIGPQENARFRTSTDGSSGIKSKFEEYNGKLVYELKVPMVIDDDHYFAIGTRIGETIGIGFETNKPDFGNMRGNKGGGMNPGGGGSRGGMGLPGGRRSGGPGMGREMMDEDFELWTEVTLASNELMDNE